MCQSVRSSGHALICLKMCNNLILVGFEKAASDEVHDEHFLVPTVTKAWYRMEFVVGVHLEPVLK